MDGKATSTEWSGRQAWLKKKGKKGDPGYKKHPRFRGNASRFRDPGARHEYYDDYSKKNVLYFGDAEYVPQKSLRNLRANVHDHVTAVFNQERTVGRETLTC